MADEAKLRKQQDRGERAKRLLENELLNEALDKMEADITAAWQNSRADDDKGRYNAYLMHRLMQNFRDHLTRIAQTGSDAKSELLRIRDPSRMRRAVGL